MLGCRVPDEDDVALLQPGAYGRLRGTWYASTPNGHLGDLRAHDVVEHEDGTITVSPSILVSLPLTVNGVEVGGDRTLWHGYLERGVWRSL